MDPAAITSASLMDSTQLRAWSQNDTLPEEAKIAEASRQFESLLLRQYLQDALKPMIEGVLDESGSASRIYRYFMVDTIADKMTQRNGIGISHLLQNQLHKPESNNHNLNNNSDHE